MAKRTKKRVVEAPSKAELGQVMKNFAEASSRIKALEAQEELELLEVRKAFEEKARMLLEQKQLAMEKLEAFGIHNKEEFFSKKKSMDLHHGTIGFRTGTPKVNKPRSLTWSRLLETLEEKKSAFLRTKLEIDKDKIIASRGDEGLMRELDELGVNVIQEETFFIALNEAGLEGQQALMTA